MVYSKKGVILLLAILVPIVLAALIAGANMLTKGGMANRQGSEVNSNSKVALSNALRTRYAGATIESTEILISEDGYMLVELFAENTEFSESSKFLAILNGDEVIFGPADEPPSYNLNPYGVPDSIINEISRGYGYEEFN